MDIITALSDERFFKPVLKDPATWHAWTVFLRALFGLGIENREDLKLFRECTGLEEPPRERVREAYCLCGRRSGKSFVSAVLSVYLSTFRNWREVLSPGEVGWVFIIAVDKAQAAIIKRYIKAILDSSPHFKKLVKNETQEIIELRNGVNIAVKTSSFRSVRGYTLLAVILEELAFWRSEDSANPDKEVLAAVRPALQTVPDSLLIGISTPYSRSGSLYQAFRDFYGKSGGPLIWKAKSTRMNPTIDQGMIERELEADPEAAASEWLAEFRSDISAFIPSELVEAVVVQGRHELPKVEGFQYYAFVDAAGGSGQDSFTLATAHRDGSGRVVLDCIRETRPPFSPAAVVKEYSDVLKSFGVSCVEADRYAGEWVVEAFRSQGIHLRNSERSKSEIYLEFLPLVSNGSIELLDHKRLFSQLVSLERKTRSGGRDSVDNFFGHDDVANAAAGACIGANHQIIRDALNFNFQQPHVSGEDRLRVETENWLLDRKPTRTKEEDDLDALREELEEEERVAIAELSEERKPEGFTRHGW